MSIIIAKDLTKRYKAEWLALDAVNFSVVQGEIYCLLGTTSAGKTTTIDLFLNFIQPTSGRAMVNGIDANRESLKAKTYLSYIPAEPMLYEHYTARENLEFFVRLSHENGLTRDDYYTALREVGLPEKAFEMKTESFSKGWRQKIGLAIAIIRDTPAILLDEPMSGLDLNTNAELMEMLIQFRSQGKAILLTSQDPFFVRETADRVGILKEGRKVIEHTREELRHEDLQALFLDYLRGGRRDI